MQPDLQKQLSDRWREIKSPDGFYWHNKFEEERRSVIALALVVIVLCVGLYFKP